MRINKALNIDRFEALQNVVYYFICKSICGRDYRNCGRERQNCDRIAQADRHMQEVVSDLNNSIIKEVAILTNGFHEDN